MGLKKKEVLQFANSIVKHLQAHDGIDGAFGRMRDDGRRAFHYSYDVDTRPMLRKLMRQFRVLRPAVRARMRLVSSRNKIISRAVRVVDRLEAVVLGLLLERRQLSEADMKNELVRPDRNVKLAFKRLEEKGLLESTGNGNYALRPRRFVENLRNLLNERMRAAENLQKRIANGYPRLCRRCNQVVFSESCSTCHRPTELISRGVAYKYAKPAKFPIVRELRTLDEAWMKWQ
jgi:hypothetical protein